MANTDRARKLLVRTALVTSTTIATLIGAQNLAMLDARAFQGIEMADTNTDQEIIVVTPDAIRTPLPVERAAPNMTILHAAPSITILRQSGQISTSQTASTSPLSIQPPSPSSIQPPPSSIQPPSPSQITAPNPIVVQQPVPQRSRSSR